MPGFFLPGFQDPIQVPRGTALPQPLIRWILDVYRSLGCWEFAEQWRALVDSPSAAELAN